MDLATLLGLFAGFGLIGTAIVLGGTPLAFVDAPAMLIVFGGTFAVTIVSFSLDDVLRANSAVIKALFQPVLDTSIAATQVLELAELARHKGALALENVQSKTVNLPFLNEGLSLVVDGSSGDEVESIMTRKVHAMASRHARSVEVIRKAADVSPAMGLIGTLVGLVQMLGNLEDPSTIGPSMAVALLTTFYGAVLSNMVFSPLAAKLERKSGDEVLLNTIYLTGLASITRHENPRRLEMLLNTLLPPTERIEYFE
ncbi:MAG: MotA/TolQ/ExbB proton channel family protein [Alphaproteobacteria bacterium]